MGISHTMVTNYLNDIHEDAMVKLKHWANVAPSTQFQDVEVRALLMTIHAHPEIGLQQSLDPNQTDAQPQTSGFYGVQGEMKSTIQVAVNRSLINKAKHDPATKVTDYTRFKNEDLDIAALLKSTSVSGYAVAIGIYTGCKPSAGTFISTGLLILDLDGINMDSIKAHPTLEPVWTICPCHRRWCTCLLQIRPLHYNVAQITGLSCCARNDVQ